MKDNALEATFFIIIAKHLHHICITFVTHAIARSSQQGEIQSSHTLQGTYEYTNWELHVYYNLGSMCRHYLGNTNTLRICIASKEIEIFLLNKKNETGGNFF
jgi:hypothetical protein